MTEDLIRELLVPGLIELGIDPVGGRLDKLRTYLADLTDYNSRVNLIATNAPQELIIRHLLDSLSALQHFTPGHSIADIGSGGGLPGIPLAIFLDSSVTLIESKRKKTDFLRQEKMRLGLKNLEVVTANVNELKGSYDIITARAFAEVKKILKLTRGIRHDDTVFILYKGTIEKIENEITGLSGSTEIIPLKVPFLASERNLLLVRA